MKSTNSIQKDIISNFQTLDDDFEMILNYLISNLYLKFSI